MCADALSAKRVKEHLEYIVLRILIGRRLSVGRVEFAATKDKSSNLGTGAGDFFVKANREWCKLEDTGSFLNDKDRETSLKKKNIYIYNCTLY